MDNMIKVTLIAEIAIMGSFALNTETTFNSPRFEKLVNQETLGVTTKPIPGVRAELKEGVLTIESDDASDWVEVQQTDTQMVVHSFSQDRKEHLGQYSFPVADVSKIQFFGNGGDDRFIAGYENNLITVDCFIDTGTDSNFIVGGLGDNTYANNSTASSMFVWLGLQEIIQKQCDEYIRPNFETGEPGYYKPVPDKIIPGNNRWAEGSKEGKFDGFLLLSYDARKATEYAPLPEYPNRPWKGEEVFQIVKWINEAKELVGNYKYFTGCHYSRSSTLVIGYINDKPDSRRAGEATLSGNSFTLYPGKYGTTQSTFYHEMAHLWDGRGDSWDLGNVSFAIVRTPHTSIPEGVDVMDKFGIREDAVPEDFAGGYGMSNSAEDWATMVAFYLMKGKPDGKSSKKFRKKYQIVDEFFRYTINPPPPNPPKPKEKSAYAATAAPNDPNAQPITIPGTRVMLMPAHTGMQGWNTKDLDNPKLSHPMTMTYYDWTEEDIIKMTSHVKFVYDKLGSYAFLHGTNDKTKNSGGNVYCYKYDEGTWGSANMEDDTINFQPGAIYDLSVFIHEVAHLWQAGSDNPFFDEFKAISWEPDHEKKEGSTSGDFASEYGETNSHEDWATAVTYVMMGGSKTNPTEVWNKKVDVINRFFRQLGRK